MKRATFWAPLAAAAFGILWFAGTGYQHRERGDRMHLSKFAQVPIQDGGRIKPLDTYARIQLMLLSRRQTYYDEFDHRQEAIRWLLNLYAEGYARYQARTPLTISDPDVAAWFGLKPRPIGRYGVGEVMAALKQAGPDKQKQLRRLLESGPVGGDPVERKAYEVLQKYKEQGEQVESMHKAREKEGSDEKANVFRIDNDQLLALMDLKPREGYRYSYGELARDGVPLDEVVMVTAQRLRMIRRLRGMGQSVEGPVQKMLAEWDETDGDRYIKQFVRKAILADLRDDKDRDLVDVKTLELFQHLITHAELKQLGGVPLVPPHPNAQTITALDTRKGTITLQGRRGEETYTLTPNVRLFDSQGQSEDSMGRPVTIDDFRTGDDVLPVVSKGQLAELKKEQWTPLGRVMLTGDQGNPAASSLEKIVQAYAVNDAKTFNKEVDGYLKAMQTRMPDEMRRVRMEAWFNHFAPFYQCTLLYPFILVLAVLSWVVWHEPLRRAAFSLAVVVAIVHTFALALRMYLTGRPPVTNLYSSAVFIGWGCVLLCLLVEVILGSVSIRSHSIPLVVSSVLGFATLIVAHHLGGSGDTMEVMQAVLDTNFWLATHVVAVTFGYTATFAAGFFAMVFIFLMLATTVRKFFVDATPPQGREAALFILAVVGWLGIPTLLVLGMFCGLWVLLSGGEGLNLGVAVVLSLPLLFTAGIYAGMVIMRRFAQAPNNAPPGELPPLVAVLDALALRQNSSKILSTMVYGIICFATLLSFVGTVLGGIWADQSWGRFWGWDPKENGALLIVVMNVLILHARWGGLIRERGLAVLAIVGNMVTAWSWFGTNQLGVGLHAYGFNNSLAMGCSIFWVSQVGLLSLGLMPLRFWRAYAEPMAEPPRPLPAVPPGPRLSGKRGGTGIQPK
jgi:ABC-type transport system involved in cytochrome c biogenesis permease subunit